MITNFELHWVEKKLFRQQFPHNIKEYFEIIIKILIVHYNSAHLLIKNHLTV